VKRVLNPNDSVLVDGTPFTIGEAIAESFTQGDRLIGLSGGQLLHIPLADLLISHDAVTQSIAGFRQMQSMSPKQVTRFFDEFARLLGDDQIFQQIQVVNKADVLAAKDRGRSTTRLILTESMRRDMISALLTWAQTPHVDGSLLGETEHSGWKVSALKAPLGVVAFIFEGRPNVFADATGVLRSGNSCVFRIGSDALSTAQAIMDLAVRPALTVSGLPSNAVTLVESRSHASGWALFSDRRVSLAIARGSGNAVAQLGAVAQQHGIPASLHGTGGAWMIAGDSADARRFDQVVLNSLDRKVCNTLNVCCIVRSRAKEFVPFFVDALARAASLRNSRSVLHVDHEAKSFISTTSSTMTIAMIEHSDLATEWEWENDPECSLIIVENIQEAVALFNQYAPKFIVSVISEDPSDLQQVWRDADAPFVGNGMTRWVDGQFALDKPELGLSNWQSGRILGRGGILSGDSVFSVRYLVDQQDADLHR